MPYRRLPNTDRARLKALQTALTKGRELPPFKLAFTQATFVKIQNIIPAYEHALSEYRNSYNLFLERNKEYQKYLRKARLYISHFIQVTHMAVQRGELPSNTLGYFDLEKEEKKSFLLNNDLSLLEFGTKLIEGEKVRRMEGLTPITNPTIAVVRVHFEKYVESFHHQESLKKRNERSQNSLNEKRALTDQIIQVLWNEIEYTFKDLPEDLKREKASEYGVVYVFRKNEISLPQLYDSGKLVTI